MMRGLRLVGGFGGVRGKSGWRNGRGGYATGNLIARLAPSYLAIGPRHPTAPFLLHIKTFKRDFTTNNNNKNDRVDDETDPDKIASANDVRIILRTREMSEIPDELKQKYGEEAILNVWAQFDEEQRKAKTKPFTTLLSQNLGTQGTPDGKLHDEDDSNLLNASDMPEYEENHSNYFFWLGALVVLFLAYKKIKAEREYQKQKLTPEELLFEEETLFKIKKLPTGFLSRCWGYLTSICLPYFLQLPVNKLYAYAFSCNLEEAEKEVGEYKSLGDFFCRRLKEGARPLAPDSFLVSPVDGKIVHFGLVDDEFDEMEQIKEVTYSLTEFLGEDSPIVKKIRERRQQRELNYTNHLAYEQEATDFYYCIIYLAPGDYHGYHSPVDWTATQREHFPGHLFPVSYWSVSRIEGLFALNERVVVSGNWKYGEFSYTPVGAYNVGSMDLAFDEELVTNSDHPPEPLKIYSEPVVLNQGDNIGFFHLGSTVVLVFEAPKMVFTKDRGEKVKMGEKLAVKLTPELAHLHKKRIEEETIYMDTLYQRKLKALTSKEMTYEVISFKQERLWEQYRVRNKILKELRQSFYPKVEPDTVEMLKQKKDELRERVAKEKEEP